MRMMMTKMKKQSAEGRHPRPPPLRPTRSTSLKPHAEVSHCRLHHPRCPYQYRQPRPPSHHQHRPRDKPTPTSTATAITRKRIRRPRYQRTCHFPRSVQASRGARYLQHSHLHTSCTTSSTNNSSTSSSNNTSSNNNTISNNNTAHLLIFCSGYSQGDVAVT